MKRILIVEDDCLLNKTLAYNLTSDGYETEAALNVKNATSMLKKTKYDLILRDMPRAGMTPVPMRCLERRRTWTVFN